MTTAAMSGAQCPPWLENVSVLSPAFSWTRTRTLPTADQLNVDGAVTVAVGVSRRRGPTACER